jgi:hypothetical protein
MSELPTSPEHHPLRPTLKGAAQTTLTMDVAVQVLNRMLEFGRPKYVRTA